MNQNSKRRRIFVINVLYCYPIIMVVCPVHVPRQPIVGQPRIHCIRYPMMHQVDLSSVVVRVSVARSEICNPLNWLSPGVDIYHSQIFRITFHWNNINIPTEGVISLGDIRAVCKIGWLSYVYIQSSVWIGIWPAGNDKTLLGWKGIIGSYQQMMFIWFSVCLLEEKMEEILCSRMKNLPRRQIMQVKVHKDVTKTVADRLRTGIRCGNSHQTFMSSSILVTDH